MRRSTSRSSIERRGDDRAVDQQSTSRRFRSSSSTSLARRMATRNIRHARRPRGRPRNDSNNKPTSDGILDAAELLFAERGFGNTSLRGLIEASRMSTTAFYSRFASKEEVLAQ